VSPALARIGDGVVDLEDVERVVAERKILTWGSVLQRGEVQAQPDPATLGEAKRRSILEHLVAKPTAQLDRDQGHLPMLFTWVMLMGFEHLGKYLTSSLKAIEAAKNGPNAMSRASALVTERR
jgi:hypothetical protein